MAIARERADAPTRLVEIARQAEWGAMRIFVPASFVVLATGVATTINGDLD
jgi:ABC-type anion transport system duplicated permease subunit